MAIKDLRFKLGQLVSGQREVLERAGKESRALDAQEESAYDARDKEIDALSKQIEREERQIERERALLETQPAADAPDERGEKPENRAAELTESVGKFFMGGVGNLSATERRSWYEALPKERRALQSDIGTAGGYTVMPQQFVAQLIKAADDSFYIRQLGTFIDVPTAASLGYPALTTRAAAGTWGGEVSTITPESTLVVEKRELYPKNVNLEIDASRQWVRQSAIAAESFVRGELGYSIGRTMETAFMTGSGAGRPLGLFTASAAGIPTSQDVTFTSSTAIDADKCIEIVYNIHPEHAANARWIAHRSFWRRARQLKGGDGHYLWQPGLNGGPAGTFIGYPVISSELAPSTFTSQQYVCLFGDLKYYYGAIALDMEVQVVTELLARTSQIGYIMRASVDAMPVLATAFTRGILA